MEELRGKFFLRLLINKLERNQRLMIGKQPVRETGKANYPQ